MTKLTFLCGAGASAMGGCPVMANFMPRARQLAETNSLGKYASDFEIVSEVQRYLFHNQTKSSLDINNIENLYSAIDLAISLGGMGELSLEQATKAHNSLARIIPLTLEKTQIFSIVYKNSYLDPDTRNRMLSDAEIVPPRGYNEISKFTKDALDHYDNLGIEFITFNYDIGLESSLYINGLQPSADSMFLSPLPSRNEVRVHKLHGSVHWNDANIGKPNSLMNTMDAIDALGKSLAGKTSAIQNEMLTFDLVRQSLDDDLTPIIVPPTDDKVTYRSDHSNVWKSAGRAISSSDAVAIIGYSMPSTDLFFRLFWALATANRHDLRRIYVIDKSMEMTEKFKQIVGEPVRDRVKFAGSDIENGISAIQRDIAVSDGTFSTC